MLDFTGSLVLRRNLSGEKEHEEVVTCNMPVVVIRGLFPLKQQPRLGVQGNDSTDEADASHEV